MGEESVACSVTVAEAHSVFDRSILFVSAHELREIDRLAGR